jgi:hypothetical protein
MSPKGKRRSVQVVMGAMPLEGAPCILSHVFSAEGSDHVPAKCPLYPAVIAAIQLSRANQLAALVDTQDGEAKTPVDKKAKASTSMDSGNALNNPKKRKISPNDAEPRRATTGDSISR